MHLRGEHCYVLEVSATALLHRDCQEESTAVPREERFLVLEHVN